MDGNKVRVWALVWMAGLAGLWAFGHFNEHPAAVGTQLNELHYSHAIADLLGGKAEVPTPAGTRCDVATKVYAIEVEWPNKWAESFGQAVHYADELRLSPAVVILRGRVPNDGPYLARIHALGTRHGVAVWEYDIQRGVFTVGPD